MLDLGLNTFTLPTSWMDLDFAPDGALSRCDFTRLTVQVQEDIPANVPAPRFLFLNMQGMYRFLETRYGWKASEPRFEKAIKAWVSSIATEMGGLKVEPTRLIIETFDEPGPGDLPMAMQMAGWVKEAVPGMQTMFYASGVSRDPAWAEAAKAHDIIAPSVAQCTPENLAFLKTLGKRLWVYDCQANAETFHPLAYYRLMPWMCWQSGITGWGHFHWFNTSHDRPYRAWDGVEAQNLVYPDQSGAEAVLSRRYLAIRAGHEDYRLLQALGKVVADAPPDKAEAATRAKAFLATAGQRALELSPRQPGYETQIVAALPPDRVDRLREEAVAHIEALSPAVGELTWHAGSIIARLTVDSTAPSYSKRPLNDGIRMPAVKFEPEYAWISGGEAVEHWVELDLGRPRQVSEAGLWWMTFTGLPQRTLVQYLDGTVWQPVSATPAWRPAAGAVETITFTPVTTTKLRVLQAAGGGGPGGPNLMGLSEIEVR